MADSPVSKVECPVFEVGACAVFADPFVSGFVFDLGCFGFNLFLTLAKLVEFLLAFCAGVHPLGDDVIAGFWGKQLFNPVAVVSGAFCVLDFPRGRVDFVLGVALLIGECQALLYVYCLQLPRVLPTLKGEPADCRAHSQTGT